MKDSLTEMSTAVGYRLYYYPGWNDNLTPGEDCQFGDDRYADIAKSVKEEKKKNKKKAL